MAQPSRSGRVLAAVLFTDIVDSTAVAEELGDQRWKTLLDRHNALVRRELKRFGGRELDTAGDGFFASFREPAPAITCASAVTQKVRELGIETRAGIHFGECERAGRKLAGITVVIGARIASLAGPGDVLVSSTAAELARGAGFGFEDLGARPLKGVEGEWRMCRVSSVNGHPLPAAAPAEEAKARRDALVAETPRRRWSRPVALAVAGLALLAAVGLAITLTRDEAVDLPGPDSIARVAAAGSAFDRVISVGANAYPQAIATGGGKLWVVNAASKTLTEIDPSSGQASVLTGTPSTPTGIAFAEGRLWVTLGFSSEARSLRILDPESRILETARFAVPDGSYPIAAGRGRVWIADPLGSTVTQYNPVTQQIDVVRLPADSGPVALGVTEDGPSPLLWVASGREPSVFLVDAAHPRRPVRTFGTRGAVPTALAVAPDNSAWVASEQSDTVLGITATGMIRVHRIFGGRCDGPTGIAATRDAVWVACGNSREVVRLNPSDGSVEAEIPVGGAPGAMAVERGRAVWVAIQRASFG